MSRSEVPPSRAEQQQDHPDADEGQAAPTGEQAREELPRDGQDQGDDPPVRDRPGDAGLDGMRVSGRGEVTPAPEDASDAPDQDPVVEERRAHLRESGAP